MGIAWVRNPQPNHLAGCPQKAKIAVVKGYDIPPPTSVLNGLGARAAPRGNCQEDWTGPDDNLHPALSRDILGLQGLSKDHGPHKVRHYYAVLIKGSQGTVVDCRFPDKEGGDP